MECLLTPNFKTPYVFQLTAEHSHVSMPVRYKSSGADHIPVVNSFDLGRRDVFWKVDPNRVLIDRMFEVITVKIDRVSFELKVQVTNYAHKLMVIGLRIRDELYQADLLRFVRAIARMVASLLC